jgi:hypothetical protein
MNLVQKTGCEQLAVAEPIHIELAKDPIPCSAVVFSQKKERALPALKIYFDDKKHACLWALTY